MPEPKYTWEAIKNDPAKLNELFRIVGELQKRLKLTDSDYDSLAKLKDLSSEKKVPLTPQEAVRLQLSVPQSAERVAKTLETMKELVEHGDERGPDFEDCMANLSSTLSKVKKALPDKFKSLGEIEGFGDLSASADALLPEPGTAGQYALMLQDGIWANDGIPSELLGMPKLMTYFEYMALEKTTRGAADWRKVPAVPEAHREYAEKLNQVFGDCLDTAPDNFDKEMEPNKDDPMILSSPGRHEPERFVTERMGLNMEENRKAYVSRLNKEINNLEAKNREALKNGRADEVTDFRTEFRADFNIVMLRSMAAARIKEGVLSYMDLADSYFDWEKLINAGMGDFMEKHSQEDVKRLLAADDRGEAFTKAFRQHLVEVDKLPETVDSYFLPTAKERIEFLQAQMRQKGANSADKLRFAAGIIAAREAVNAKRGSVGKMDSRLNEHIGPGMAERARTWEKRLGQLTPEQQEKIFALAVKGHGGAMKEQVYDLLKDNPEMENVPRSADKWIELYQKDLAPGKDIDTDAMVNIMAVRMLANSVRGDKKSLTGKMLTAAAIAEKAEALKENKTFREFVLDDPKAVSAARSGHGGALDDMFKKFLKEQPAGELVNDPLLARYMPTVKERIELLQEQLPNHPTRLCETVAEIVVLRNLAHAERGKAEAASLNKPIPMDERGSLKKDVDRLHRDNAVLAMVYKVKLDAAFAMIAKEHGGEMVEYFRGEVNGPDHSMPPYPESIEIFNANTISTRLGQLKEKAKTLYERAEENPQITNASMEEARAVLGEYILLDKQTRDPKTGRIGASRLLADAPRSKVETSRAAGFEKNEPFKEPTEAMGDDLVTDVMKDLAKMGQKEFFESLGRKMSAAMQKKQTGVPSRETEQPKVEKELNKAAVRGQ